VRTFQSSEDRYLIYFVSNFIFAIYMKSRIIKVEALLTAQLWWWDRVAQHFFCHGGHDPPLSLIAAQTHRQSLPKARRLASGQLTELQACKYTRRQASLETPNRLPARHNDILNAPRNYFWEHLSTDP